MCGYTGRLSDQLMNWLDHKAWPFIGILLSLFAIVADLSATIRVIVVIASIILVVGGFIVSQSATGAVISVTKQILRGIVRILGILGFTWLTVQLLVIVLNIFTVKPILPFNNPVFPTFVADDRDRVEDMLREGDQCYVSANYNCAIDAYSKAIELDKDSFDRYPNSPYVRRARAYRSKGDYDLAISDYTQLIRQYIRSNNSYRFDELYRERGELYQLAGYTDSTIAEYITALTVTNNYDVRQDLLSRLRKLEKNPPFQVREFKDNINLHTLTIQNDPKNYKAYYDRGHSYYLIGDYQHAIEDFTSAIQVGQEQLLNNSSEQREFLVVAFHQRAIAFREAGQREKAIADFLTALEKASEITGYAGTADIKYHLRQLGTMSQ